MSSYPLNEHEVSVLTTGLKFVPKPAAPSPDSMRCSVDDFTRRIKLTYFFAGVNDGKSPKPFIQKSDWTPPDPFIHKVILERIGSIDKSVKDINLFQGNSNLPKEEIKALHTLRTNRRIVIKPADKGSSIVIMNKNDYLQEGYRQLANEKYYKRINDPIHPSAKDNILAILNTLKDQKRINKKQYDYLAPPDNPRERRFYLLPKIHKDKNSWTNNGKMPPGRPIVSDCNSDTYKLSEYIDHFLAPLAKKHSSYIKDTSHFLDRLTKIRVPADSHLITLDVDSLYTNIDNTEGLKAVREAFKNNPDAERPDKAILSLLNICLKNNDFMFSDEWYLQIGGTAMGKKFAPNYANLFLANWEKEVSKKCNKRPLCFFRYLDDIFLIWHHPLNQFWDYFNILNTHHPDIKLKHTISEQSIDFLDVTIFKGKQFHSKAILDTKVFFKPTDTHELLHKKSYHPKHTFRGIIKSQIIRFHRICSNPEDFHHACSTLFTALKKRHYTSSFLRKIKRETLHALKPTGQSEKCNKSNCLTCPYIEETHTLKSSLNKPVYLKETLNCQTMSLVYLIQCRNCGIMYVGETARKLHQRITEHRSDINTGKGTQVAMHFNNTCPGIDNLSVVPLEHVSRPRSIPNSLGLLPLSDMLPLLRREQYWINKLKTQTPSGLNKRNELPPPIPFILKYNDQAGKITQIIKQNYDELQKTAFGTYKRK